ncbi:MAG: response regulator [Planctomycetes bacterium]|nr:response regulator [Planctomycetota bacterium]
MFRLSARTRITLGLVGLVVSILLLAMLLGIVPDRTAARCEGRAQLCEAVALASSAMISRRDLPQLEATLKGLVRRNEELHSAGVRRADGRLLASINDHAAEWGDASAVRSTETHVRVPLYEGRSRWGTVELRFSPLTAKGLARLWTSPQLRLLVFLGVGSFLLFTVYLYRMLQHLDPSQAVPHRVRSALDTLAEGLLVLDRDGRIVLANQAFAQVLGKSPHELLGRTADQLPWHRPDEQEAVVYPWRIALDTERPQANVPMQLTDCAEGVRTFNVNCSPVLGHDGSYRGVLASFDDVTELQSQKVALARSKDAAESANRAKSDFLANMSHEIRTPMNAILGFTDVLRRGFAEDADQQRQYLDTIHTSGRHLLALINDILDLSKVEAGHLQIELQPCSPFEIASEVVSVLSERARQKGLMLELAPDGLLPERIDSDSTRLRQILTNLVGNAIKFTESGGVRVALSLDRSGQEPELVVEVTDTGIGISEEAIAKIFDPFVQADSSVNRRFGGTGLGLSISRRFAEALGGELTASSRPGAGSTFRLALPAGSLEAVRLLSAEELAGALRQRAPEARKPTGCNRWASDARILVADDGRENRALVRLVLERAGAVVEEALDGGQAIERALAERFDLVLMDMQMPVMDGYTASRTLRERGFTAPIIALTAAAMRGDEERCRQAGCTGFLAKPVDLDALLEVVARELNTACDDVISGPVESTDTQREESAEIPLVAVEQSPALPASAQPGSLKRLINELCEAQLLGDLDRIAELARQLSEHSPAAEAHAKQPAAIQTAAANLLHAARARRWDDVADLVGELAVACTFSASGGCEPQPPHTAAFAPAEPLFSTLPADDSELQSWVIGFVPRLRARLRQMPHALDQGDYERLAFEAHWLKGAAGTMGFDPFTEPAARLEAAATDGNRPAAAAALAEVLALGERVQVIPPQERPWDAYDDDTPRRTGGRGADLPAISAR